MKKYLVTQKLEYVIGHLRRGHFQIEVKAENEEEAKKIGEEFFNQGDGDIIVDDYEIDDYGPTIGKIEAEEIGE